MEDREFIKNIKKMEAKNKKKTNKGWVLLITFISLIISIIFSLLCELFMPTVNIIIGLIIMFSFILLGIAFDILGVSVTIAEISPYHSMAAKKVRGAKVAVKLKQNNSKISTIFCDVIGDISGIVSGSAGVYLSIKISSLLNINALIVSLLVTGMISSITIGGKAIGKTFAINNGTTILYNFSKMLSIFYNPKK